MSHLPPAQTPTSDQLGRGERRQSTDGFQTTNWSVIARLDSPDFSEALAQLCQQYWYPVYAFVRRHTSDVHRSEDLTQGFFCKVISLQTFRMADRERGRFRSFLLTSVKNFLASEYQASQAQKRSGDETALALDFARADQMYQSNRSAQPTPDRAFDRAWALSAIEHAIDRLRADYQRNGDGVRFELFVPALRSSKLDYKRIADQLEVSEVAARKAASRFRAHYGEQLRREIAATLADGESVDAEIDWMMSVLSVSGRFS